MTPINHSRGHELADHRDEKPIGRQMLREADFDLAICEHTNADVVGIRRVGDHLHVLAIEFERTVRNIIPNIHRDLAHKCDLVLVVCLPPLTKDTVERLLARKLTALDRTKVVVVLRDQLTVELLRSMNGSEGVISGCFRLIHKVQGVNSEGIPTVPQVISGCFTGEKNSHVRAEAQSATERR